MTTKEQMNAIFKEFNDFFKEIRAMDNKQSNAKQNIIDLQEEMKKLREQRPSLLADGKSVVKINKRLKNIEEEIELNEDLIKGIATKKSNCKDAIYNMRVKKQEAFKGYVKNIMNNLAKEYMEIAPKFAEIIRDYILLEYMYYGTDTNYLPAITYEDIQKIPGLRGNKTLFNYNLYDLFINYDDVVKEKYDIPEYEVHRISRP